MWTNDSRTTRHHRLVILIRFSRPAIPVIVDHPAIRQRYFSPISILVYGILSAICLYRFSNYLQPSSTPLLALASIALANPHVAHPRHFRLRLAAYHQFATLLQLSRADIRSESLTATSHSL